MIRVRDGVTIHITRGAGHGINGAAGTPAGTVAGCTVTGPRNTRATRNRADAITANRYLFAPAGADLQAGDRFKINGTGATHRIIQQDSPSTSHLTGHHMGLECWEIEATQ